jgi:DNA-binding NarL/FixJ family response regulator
MVVDDHELLRSGFAMVLGSRPGIEVVAEAGDGAEAIRRLAQAEQDGGVDVVLMDIRMPGMDGLEATRRIIASGSAARLLVLTTFEVDEYVLDAVRAGASGFLLKDAPADDLERAVRAVAAGESALSPRIATLLMRHVARASATLPRSAGPDLAALTAREAEVLRLVAGGLSNTEVAAALVLSEATVKTHVSRILMKLGLRDRVQAVVAAYEAGLVTPGDGARGTTD